MSDKTIHRLRTLKAALKKRLRGHPDVVALGVGYREQEGRIVQRGCIRVHVRKKFEMDAIPKRLRLPRSIRGVPIDVVESNFVSHDASPAGRFDPLVGGVVVTGAAQFSATNKVGSAGCIAPGNGEPLLLSCWHVLYGPTGKNGDIVVQPRPSGTLNNIGTTLAGIISTRVDCAVATLNGDRETSQNILGISDVTLGRTEARPGLFVRKSGANGVGLGVVVGTDTDPPVVVGGELRSFVDQIEIVARPNLVAQFKAGEADSGALWISDDDNRIVGLHFAGGVGRVLANPIDAVVDALAAEGIVLGL